MAPLTPRRSNHPSQLPLDGNSAGNRDHNTILASPSRSRSALGTTSMFTTVDQLILPGVIGATVEGPKTPIRSPSSTRRFSNFIPNASVGSNTNGLGNYTSTNGHSNMPHVSSPRASSHHINNASRPANGRASPGLTLTSAYYYPNTSHDHAQEPGQGQRNYVDIEPPSEEEDDKENDPTRMPTSPQGAHRETYPDSLDLEAYTRQARQSRSDRYQTTVENDDVNRYLDDNDAYERKHQDGGGEYDDLQVYENNGYNGNNYNDDALDIGGYEDEIYPQDRLRSNFYSDPEIEGEEIEVFMDDDAKIEELEREAAELKREQDQLGFIKRVANLLRKQRDEYGWGTPRRQQERQQMQQELMEVSDSDSDRQLTSARVRKGSYSRRPRVLVPTAKANTVPALPRSLTPPATRQTTTPPALHRSTTPQALQRTLTPQALQRTITPRTLQRTITPSDLHRTTTPPALRRTTTPPATRRTPTPPASAPHHSAHKANPFTVPTMRQLDSGIGMTASQDSHEEEYEAEEETDNWKPLRAEGLRHHQGINGAQDQSRYYSDNEYDLKYEHDERREQVEYASAESDDDHPPSYEISSATRRRLVRQQIMEQDPIHRLRRTRAVAHKRVYPWHVVWRMLQDGAQQLRDLFLAAVDTVQLILWLIFMWLRSVFAWPWRQRHTVWNTGESWVRAGVTSGLLSPGTLVGVGLLGLAVWGSHSLGYSASTEASGINCDNATTSPNPRPASFLKDAIADTWDKLAWRPSSSESSPRSRLWKSWIPQAPSLSHWIPSRTGKEAAHEVQIPPEQIKSFEELESAVKWIQKTLVDHLSEDQDSPSTTSGKWSWRNSKSGSKSAKVVSWDAFLSENEQALSDFVESHMSKVSWDDFLNENKRAMSDFVESHMSKVSWDEFLSENKRAMSDFVESRMSTVSWDDFLSENERAMSDFVEGRLSKVSRDEFLNLVRTEAGTIWQGLEKNVVALLEKQGKLQGGGASASRPRYGGSPSTADNSVDGRVLTDVERDLISELIDEALEKYAADAMAKPDYALFSAGGRIIPRLTHTNYHHFVEPTFWGNLGLKYFVSLPRREKPAEKAIEPGMHAGECWAMEGHEGQLAIRLARKIVVTEVTIEHADPSVVLDMNSAPQLVEVWGLQGSQDSAPISKHPAHTSAAEAVDHSEASSTTDQSDNNNTEEDREKEDRPWPGAMFLTTVEYNTLHTMDGIKPKTRQTFSIPLSKQTSPSVGVVLRIKSNWGHPKYTCLYRVRVHGYEPTTA